MSGCFGLGSVLCSPRPRAPGSLPAPRRPRLFPGTICIASLQLKELDENSKDFLAQGSFWAGLLRLQNASQHHVDGPTGRLGVRHLPTGGCHQQLAAWAGGDVFSWMLPKQGREIFAP